MSFQTYMTFYETQKKSLDVNAILFHKIKVNGDQNPPYKFCIIYQ